MVLKWSGKKKQPQGNPGGKVARPEEAYPKRDYIPYLRKLGPRDGETLLAFEARLAYIERSRELWVAAWKKAGGVATDAGELLGVIRNNVHIMLRRCGLSPALLDELAGLNRGRA